MKYDFEYKTKELSETVDKLKAEINERRRAEEFLLKS